MDPGSGDVFEVPLPRAAYDLVLLGNLCHLFDADANRLLFRRLRPAIGDGGRIAVIDVTPSSADQVTRRWVNLYAVGLMTRTSGGGVHTAESYRAWLAEAGFRDTCFSQTSTTPSMSVVTAARHERRRPGAAARRMWRAWRRHRFSAGRTPVAP